MTTDKERIDAACASHFLPPSVCGCALCVPANYPTRPPMRLTITIRAGLAGLGRPPYEQSFDLRVDLGDSSTTPPIMGFATLHLDGSALVGLGGIDHWASANVAGVARALTPYSRGIYAIALVRACVEGAAQVIDVEVSA